MELLELSKHLDLILGLIFVFSVIFSMNMSFKESLSLLVPLYSVISQCRAVIANQLCKG